MFQRYEKWKVGEKLGSKAHPCYIRIRVITNRVISRFKCILFIKFKSTEEMDQNLIKSQRLIRTILRTVIPIRLIQSKYLANYRTFQW